MLAYSPKAEFVQYGSEYSSVAPKSSSLSAHPVYCAISDWKNSVFPVKLDKK